MNTAILILNWNGSSDTIACLKSLLSTLGSNDYVFVIDNGSTDNSINELNIFFQTENKFLKLTTEEELQQDISAEQKFYLIQNKNNLGFGAGNNVVLKQLSRLQINFKLVWLLNNDTLVNEKTLSELKKSILKENNIAVSGSLILNYPDTSTIQCSGVKHYKFFGVSKLINKNLPLAQLNKQSKIKFDYLNGASLMFKTEALQQVKFFDERFFLYSEEFDLQLCLLEKQYELSLSLESIVYHHLSGGTSKNRHLFFYYYNTSSILLSKKHFSFFNTFCATFNLITITFIRSFPSIKNFWWGIKGIANGLRK